MPSCGGSPGWWGSEAVSGPIRLRLSVGGLAHTYLSWAATVAPCGELQRHPNCAPQVGIGEGGQHRSDGVGEWVYYVAYYGTGLSFRELGISPTLVSTID